MTIDNIIEMGTEPGVVVVGQTNVPAREVFDEIVKELSEFYQDTAEQYPSGHGLQLVSEIYKSGKTKYFLPVYDTEIPEMEIDNQAIDADGKQTQTVKTAKPKQHGNVKVELIDEQQIVKYVKEWDFPHEPARGTKYVFAVYFNPIDRGSASTERDNFMTFLRPGV